jgi:hypothetical protein
MTLLTLSAALQCSGWQGSSDAQPAWPTSSEHQKVRHWKRTKGGLHEQAAGVADVGDQQPDAAAEELGRLAHLQTFVAGSRGWQEACTNALSMHRGSKHFWSCPDSTHE